MDTPRFTLICCSVDPAAAEALRFSIDTHPAYALRRLGGDLPFGCHSWTKRRMRRAWRGIIPAAK